MKTSIKKTGSNTVTLKAIDPYSGEPVEREFWIPNSGGYVREGDRQVCVGLDRLGNTLDARDGDELLETIRYNWRIYRRNAARDRDFSKFY
ncbi:MAG: hypothetical protein AAF661_15150 [Pseudomonadota bacterium]